MATPTTPATAAKAVTSGSKVGSIGTVKSLVGSATAVDQNGVKRELQVGDKVFANEMIQTSAAGIIVIEFVNGQSMDLGRGSQILLNKDIFDPSQAAAEKSDVEAIQAQIAAGADPTQVAEATAAGAGAGDEGGSSFVVVDPSFAQGQVTSGFPTAGIPTPEFQTEEYLGVVEPVVEPTGELPVVAISDGDPNPQIEGIVQESYEGDEESGNTIVFTVSLSAPSDQAVTVDYMTVDGTAVAGSDYYYQEGTLTFAPGETTKTITITLIGDDVHELAETFTVELSNAVLGGTTAIGIADDTGVGNIVDDDPAPVVSIDDITIYEGGEDGSATASFTISIDRATYEDVTVEWSVADVTTLPSDYSGPTSGTATIAAGTTSVVVSEALEFTATDDEIHELNETFEVTLDSVSGGDATGAGAVGTGTVVSDDPPPVVSIDDITIYEDGETGSATASFTISIDRPTYEDVTVNWSVADVSTLPTDYSGPTSGTATIAAGTTSVVVSEALEFTATDDEIHELNETFEVTLDSVSGGDATGAGAVGTGTVVSDDPPPVFTIDDVTVTEGVNPTITFTVTLTGDTSLASTVNYTVNAGTATTPGDYTGTLSGMLTFPPGTTTQTVTLNITDDSVIEPTETFTVALSGATNATIGDASGLGTILDNDVPPPNFLNGSLITNTNNTVQNTILTFVQQDDPTSAYAKHVLLPAQGQGVALNQDIGFNIDPSKDYVVSLEALPGSTKTLVTAFNLEGVVIDPPGGTYGLEVNDSSGGPDRTAFTAVINPDDPAVAGNDGVLVQGQTDSVDGTGAANILADTTPSTVNYLFGAGGNDTLTGSSGIDILNGGAGADSVNGGGGNDILVYDQADALLDGGSNLVGQPGDFDLLRIDGNPLSSSSVDLTGNNAIKNIEGILITDDANSDPSVGVTLTLTAEDVLNFTDADNTLYVLGNPGDKLDLGAEWTQGATENGFVTYTATVNSTTVTLLVEDTSQVTVI